MNDLEDFFKDLKAQYERERQDFVWGWGDLLETSKNKSLPPGCDMLTDYVCFIAYNLAKNVLHGRLPSHLHSRMMFKKSGWVNKYVEFLDR